MTAAALFSVAAATGIGGFRLLGQILIWPAVLVCTVLAVAAGRRLNRIAAAP